MRLKKISNDTNKLFLQEMIARFMQATENGVFQFFIPEFELLQIYILDLPYEELLQSNIDQTFFDYLAETGFIKNESDAQLYINNLDNFHKDEMIQATFDDLKLAIIDIAEKVVNRKLKRKTASPISTTLEGVTIEGKKILQMLENMKFKIEQAARVSGNDQSLAKKIMQNSDLVDKIMSSLYAVCFDLSNLDILPTYDPQQINISDDAIPDSEQKKFKLEKPIQEETSDDESSGSDESEPEQESEETSESGEKSNEESGETENSNEKEPEETQEESEESEDKNN